MVQFMFEQPSDQAFTMLYDRLVSSRFYNVFNNLILEVSH